MWWNICEEQNNWFKKLFYLQENNFSYWLELAVAPKVRKKNVSFVKDESQQMLWKIYKWFIQNLQRFWLRKANVAFHQLQTEEHCLVRFRLTLKTESDVLPFHLPIMYSGIIYYHRFLARLTYSHFTKTAKPKLSLELQF